MTDSIRSARPALSAVGIFLRYWLPVLAWCALIFAQSAFPPPEQIPRLPHFDKLLHLCAYGFLAILVCRALNKIGPLTANKRRLLIWAVTLTTLYGLSDEWHQSFVPGRTASAVDLLADFFGALAGSAFALKFLLRFRPFQ